MVQHMLIQLLVTLVYIGPNGLNTKGSLHVRWHFRNSNGGKLSCLPLCAFPPVFLQKSGHTASRSLDAYFAWHTNMSKQNMCMVCNTAFVWARKLHLFLHAWSGYRAVTMTLLFFYCCLLKHICIHFFLLMTLWLRDSMPWFGCLDLLASCTFCHYTRYYAYPSSLKSYATCLSHCTAVTLVCVRQQGFVVHL